MAQGSAGSGRTGRTPRCLELKESGRVGDQDRQVARDFQPVQPPAPAPGFAAIRPSLPFFPQRREPPRARSKARHRWDASAPGVSARHRRRRSRRWGGEPPPGYASGGMRAKLVAARIATEAGCAIAIARGQPEGKLADRPLTALAEGARCTWFLPAPEGRSARKRWIAGALAPLGAFVVDAGAV